MYGEVSAEPCTLKFIVKNYKEGLTQYKKQNYRNALMRWVPLAEAGLGPAQRQIALMYATGTGLEKSIKKARVWARLAHQGGDNEGRRLDNEFGINLTSNINSFLMSEVASWKVKSLVCLDGNLAVTSNLKELRYKIIKGKRISRQNSRLIDTGLGPILKIALKKNMANKLYLSIIDKFDFYNGSRYDRYVGWQPINKLKNKSLNVIRLSVSNLHDIKLDYFAKALLFVVKRRVFNRLPDSELIDPYMQIIAGKKVFGSVYPDVRNENYFKMIRKAFVMAEQLTRPLKRYINIIDEIHYNPASKYYRRSGTIDAKGAFYTRDLSSEGHRIMFVRRKVLFSSPLFLLQTFIHEGTHAIQDQMAFENLQEVKLTKKRISYLISKGVDPKTISNLRINNQIKVDYANRWYRGLKTKKGRIQDIAFECEATTNEIKAVKMVGALPDIMDGSGYLKLCPEAQRQIIQWRDEIRRLNYKNIR